MVRRFTLSFLVLEEAGFRFSVFLFVAQQELKAQSLSAYSNYTRHRSSLQAKDRTSTVESEANVSNTVKKSCFVSDCGSLDPRKPGARRRRCSDAAPVDARVALPESRLCLGIPV